MRGLADYAGLYRHAALDRNGDGVLTVVFHSKGGPLAWGARPHEEFGHLFRDIAADRANRVVIVTGSGDSFCDRIHGASGGTMTAAAWDHIYTDGKRMLMGLLDIAVPVIAAVNGPATIHAELAVLNDIVLAADTATFQDAPHFPAGLVPGDGAQLIWPALLGPNRGRYFLMTGQVLDAQEALRLGVVAEVSPAAELMPRARAIAADLAKKSDLVLRHTRTLLTQQLRTMFEQQLGYGLALEGMAATDHWPVQG